MKKGYTSEVRAQYCEAILYALRYFNGEAKRKDVQDFVRKILSISKIQTNVVLNSGMSKVDKDMDFARHVLKLYGFVYSPQDKECKRGYWKITSKGKRSNLTNIDFKSLIHQLDIKGYRGNNVLLRMKK